MSPVATPLASELAAGCPSPDDAAGFVAGGLSAEQRRGFAAHMDRCERCRRLVSALAAAERSTDDGASDPRSEVGLHAGQVLGRFALTRLLGHGSMGEVWAARDPELDREVALKLLRLRPGALGTEATIRLRREAQAMARLNHANVVAIYELGTDDDDRVFCAMELVDGVTLRRWLETPRSWRAVLEVAIAVARGIEAAHAAGLVHRDIKPENILIGPGGRAVVSDFGLAKLADLGADSTDGDDGGAERREDVADQPLGALTATGAVIGTPVYMAPEQLAGRAVDARCDQFSYCVTVFEALFGARPFGGETLAELAQDRQRGVRDPARLRGVPKGVVRCLQRGLAADPAARWPSMAVLAGELGRAARRPRQRRIAALAGGVAVAAIVAGVLAPRDPDPFDAAREATERRGAGAWNPGKAMALQVAFAATGSPVARERAMTAGRLLDAYRADWIALRLDAWSATQLRREQTPELLERRLACFDHLLDTMDGIVALFLAATRAEVERAPQIVYHLEPVATCGNAERLAATSAAPSTPEGKLAERQLRELEKLQIAGRHAEVLQRARALVEGAMTAGAPEVLARARFTLGTAQANAGPPVDAEATLRLALQDAAAARDHYLVAEIWLRLIEVVGLDLRHLQAADAMEPAVRAAVAQAGRDPRQVADLALTLGAIAVGRGDNVTARDQFIIARDLRIAALGPDHPAVGNDESNLSAALVNLGELDQSRVHAERAIAIIRAALGERQPVVARAEHHLAEIAVRRHDWIAAEHHARAAIATNAAVRGPDSPDTAKDRLVLAIALREQGRFAFAHAEAALARASLTRALPATHPTVIMVDVTDAGIYDRAGNWDEAMRLGRRAVDRLRHTEVSETELVEAVSQLAEITARRAPLEALPLYDEVFRWYSAQKEPDLQAGVDELRELADAALRAHRPAAALAWFDRLPAPAQQLADLRRDLEHARATPR